MAKRSYKVWVMYGLQRDSFSLSFLTSYVSAEKAIGRARAAVACSLPPPLLGSIVRSAVTGPDGRYIARFERAGFFGSNADPRYEPIEPEAIQA